MYQKAENCFNAKGVPLSSFDQLYRRFALHHALSNTPGRWKKKKKWEEYHGFTQRSRHLTVCRARPDDAWAPMALWDWTTFASSPMLILYDPLLEYILLSW